MAMLRLVKMWALMTYLRVIWLWPFTNRTGQVFVSCVVTQPVPRTVIPAVRASFVLFTTSIQVYETSRTEVDF